MVVIFLMQLPAYTNEARNMNPQQIKYHPCPWHLEQGIVVVDPETETTPQTNTEGDRLYYCPATAHIFPVMGDVQADLSLDAQKRSVL